MEPEEATAQAAPISIGSPSAVPVPCISRARHSAGASSASAMAVLMTCKVTHTASDALCHGWTSQDLDPIVFMPSGIRQLSCQRRQACGLACCWDGPCGAVKLLERPSWFTAVPPSSTVHRGASDELASTPLAAKLHMRDPVSHWQGTDNIVSAHFMNYLIRQRVKLRDPL